MSNRPFRFVHAADLHLEEVPRGVAHVPTHLTDLFLQSPYRAAERVFEAACSEHADFLVISGDLLDPARTGPRGPLFLVEQCEKLAARGIAVYWAGGAVDSPDAWPPSVHLPDNVVVFPVGRPEEVVFSRQSEPVARLLGASRTQGRRLRPNEYAAEPGGLFTVAVTHGGADPESLKRRQIGYWALGGRHQRQTLFSGPEAAHYPGTPQGRSPSDTGQFGCTLVEVDQRRTIRLTPITTNVFRWHAEQVNIGESDTRKDLETILRQRIELLGQSHPTMDSMISWTVAGSGRLLTALRRGGLADELLEMLRKAYGFGQPALWSLTLEAEAAICVPPPWFEQETVRGNFLRMIRDWHEQPRAEIDLTEYLPESYLAGSLSAAATVSDEQELKRILAEAAMLGVDLLTPEGPES